MELQIAKNGESMEDSKGKIKVNLCATTKASYTLWHNPWLDVFVTICVFEISIHLIWVVEWFVGPWGVSQGYSEPLYPPFSA